MKKAQSRYNVLIIEDNPGDYLLVEDYLQETDVVKNIYWEKNFHSAKNKLTDLGQEIDLVFLDLSLPDLGGEDLILEVQKLTNNKPIVILTGYSETDFAIKSLSLGASDYLVKDVLNPTILHKSIIYNVERNKILVNLKDSEKRYSDLFHFSPLPLWVFDQDSLKFLDVNDTTIYHYGYSYQDFLNMEITDIMERDSVTDFKSILSSLRGTHQNLFLGLQNHIKKNGEIIQVELRANSYVYKGRAAEIISINDVTEKNRQIRAIQQQNKILKDIAWTQSHVVRAPLARIMGLVNAMKDQQLNEDDQKKFFNHLLNSADELDQIIRSVVNKSQEVTIKNQKK